MNYTTIRKDSFKEVTRNLVEIYDIHHIFNLKPTDRTEIPFYLFDVKECEFRKDAFLYYSRIVNYRVIGLLYKINGVDRNTNMLSCSQCFEKVDNIDKCNSCETIFTSIEYPYFMNVNNITGSVHYARLKKKFNLGFHDEFYRDQKHSLCKPLKLEIFEKALHPDRIEKILDLTKCHWYDLDDYI
jgi:hypothetical protein